jgi:alkylated DNA repair dioxygenase AlkB
MAPHQRSLLALGAPRVDPAATWERIRLDATAWVDVCRGFLAGADTLLDELVGAIPWECHRRHMYDRMVDDPRLSKRFVRGSALPHPVLEEVRAALAARYCDDGADTTAGGDLGGVGCNYYRDGRDSVAFHGDRVLRESAADTIVAVLTLGACRPFLLRPAARPGDAAPRRSRDLAPASGDLLVMGGACQRTWEHGVPKVARCGPRISLTWRRPAPDG